ncbi:MAG TPA: hypothetical protein VI136_20655 [Verrucomicrobiae bacterium]
MKTRITLPAPASGRRFMVRASHRLSWGKPAFQALCLLLSQMAFSQSEFSFDPRGNLHAQSPEIAGPPRILSAPQPQVVSPGALASFFVVAANTRALSYQWRFEGADLPGATGDALVRTNVGLAHVGQYSVVLSNAQGSVTSAPAALMLETDGDGLPDAWEIAWFGNLNQSPTGDYDGDGVSNGDEYLDGTNPTDPDSAMYRLTVVSDGEAVWRNPERYKYTRGEQVTITAESRAEVPFRGWTGDTNTPMNPITLVVNTNLLLYAHAGYHTLQWTNTSGGNWTVRGNWFPSYTPLSGDSVVIASNVNVAVSAAVACWDLTLGEWGNPTLSGAGQLTVFGRLDWRDGSLLIDRTTIERGGSLVVAGKDVTLSYGTLENGGSAVCDARDIIVAVTTITNRPDAVFRFERGGGLGFAGGVMRFDNAGTVVKSSEALSRFAAALNNYGGVEVEGGTLELGGGGVNTGLMRFAAGTGLRLSGGTFTAGSTGSITGQADFLVSNGSVTLGGLFALSGNHTFSLGTATILGNYFCTNNTLTVSGGTVAFSGGGSVEPTNLNLSAGTMSGAATVTPLHQMTWSGGNMTGTGRTLIPPGAALNINNAATVFISGRTLESLGHIVWTGSDISLSTATILNREGALFEIQGGGQLASSGGRFDNAGTLRKTFAGTNALLAVLNNSGLVNVLDGTLQLGGGTNTGAMTFAPSTRLHFSGGTFLCAEASSISGAAELLVNNGTVTAGGFLGLSGNHTFRLGTANLTGNYVCTNNVLTISGGTVNFNGSGPVTPTTLNLSAGTLSGAATVTPLNTMTWSGGSMAGTGRTLIPAGATLTINNGGQVFLSTRTLENAGTVLWTGNDISMSSSVITNRPDARFEIRTASALAFGGGIRRFDNAGTLLKSSGGTNAFATPLTNYGLVDIRTGTLAANAGFAATPEGTLRVALGGPTPDTGYGRLHGSGTVALRGALSVELANGFLPTTNDTFTVVTAGTRLGTFENFHYPSNDVTLALLYTPTSVVVRVEASRADVHRVVLLPPEISGSDLRLTWTAVPNETYRVEFNADLASTNWQTLPGDIVGASNTASTLDILTPSNRFYRVRLVP